MTVGIITHLRNASVAETRALAAAAEEAGADWLGVPDAFWWRDTWVLLAEAARATKRIQIGPLVTNPYTRHPFQTVAALATIQDLAGPRVFLGLGAGGSEVTGAAGPFPGRCRIAHRRACRHRAAGGRGWSSRPRQRAEPGGPARGSADPGGWSCRRSPGGRRSGGRSGAPVGGALERAGIAAWGASRPAPSTGTRALLPRVLSASGRRSWPTMNPRSNTSGGTAAYATLNSRPARQAAWGLTPKQVTEVRRALVAGGAANAASLIPEAALADLIVTDTNVARVAAEAARLDVTSLALPVFDIATIGDRVAWARAVVDAAAAAVARPASSESAA